MLIMDLSDAPDNSVESLLLQMPAKDLLISCDLVSKQWHRILFAKAFWIDWAELRNYRLQWRHFVGLLSLCSVRQVAIRWPFERNLVRDAWDMTKLGSAECFVADPRWEFSDQIMWTGDELGNKARIEIPPRLFYGQKADPAGETVNECVAISYRLFQKRIVIKLADEGLTDEIMDNLAPPIVVSELVSNRGDCASEYQIISKLVKHFDETQKKKTKRMTGQEEYTKKTAKKFRQWEEESWHKIEHVFTEYRKGMRYLLVECSGKDSQFWAGNYGPKMAKFNVKALCQFNNKQSK